MTGLSCRCLIDQCPVAWPSANSQAGLGPIVSKTFKVKELRDAETAGLMGELSPGRAQGRSCLKAGAGACLSGIQGRRGCDEITGFFQVRKRE